MAGHLGIRKTKARVLEEYWWPLINRDVTEYVKTCHTCQLIGKPNQRPRSVPLKPTPVMEEPFSEIMIDIVGPLSKTTNGFSYILTIMDMATRFPEAVCLRTCTAKAVTQALLKFFTQFGLPLRIKSDQGSHFTANIIRQALEQLGIEQVFGCAYRPQTQGAIERFHQTLKSMIKTYIYAHEKDWDVGIPFLLFAARDSVQESLGFTPFELVFGHQVRGPLRLIKDRCFNDRVKEDILVYVVKMKERLRNAVQMAHENLETSQDKMKKYYDETKKVGKREFNVKDEVLLPMPGNPLCTKYTPCTIIEA